MKNLEKTHEYLTSTSRRCGKKRINEWECMNQRVSFIHWWLILNDYNGQGCTGWSQGLNLGLPHGRDFSIWVSLECFPRGLDWKWSTWDSNCHQYGMPVSEAMALLTTPQQLSSKTSWKASIRTPGLKLWLLPIHTWEAAEMAHELESLLLEWRQGFSSVPQHWAGPCLGCCGHSGNEPVGRRLLSFLCPWLANKYKETSGTCIWKGIVFNIYIYIEIQKDTLTKWDKKLNYLHRR